MGSIEGKGKQEVAKREGEKRLEYRQRNKGGRALYGKTASRSWGSSLCKNDSRRALLRCPLPSFHFQLGFPVLPPAPLQPASTFSAPRLREFEAAGRVRGLDSAQQEGEEGNSPQSRTEPNPGVHASFWQLPLH